MQRQILEQKYTLGQKEQKQRNTHAEKENIQLKSSDTVKSYNALFTDAALALEE